MGQRSVIVHLDKSGTIKTAYLKRSQYFHDPTFTDTCSSKVGMPAAAGVSGILKFAVPSYRVTMKLVIH
jgi:hypothetical protein